MANTRRGGENNGNCAESGFILTAIRRVYIIPRLMQTPSLPSRIDPWRLTAEGGRLEGALALAALPRLVAELNRTDGMASVALVASVDRQGVRFIKGAVRTEVELVCQRCLGPLRLALDVTVSLGLVRSEAEADRLPEEYEPLVVPESIIHVADLVEDELLLALPRIPRHDDVRDCEANGYRAPDRVEQNQPFATLASLLRDSQRSH
ncbi:MAG: hypothetical protein H6R23_2365 [Proteobacteria bacterium]|nr:hypothetical protein [Pseudomonadota bacterium]